MGGRYYLKRTINHLVSNENKRRKSNRYNTSLSPQDLKKITEFRISNGIEIVNKNDWAYERKLKAFKDFHYSELEIQKIIYNSYNDEFCKAYYGNTIKEYKKHLENVNTGCLFAFSIFIIVIIICIFLILKEW